MNILLIAAGIFLLLQWQKSKGAQPVSAPSPSGEVNTSVASVVASTVAAVSSVFGRVQDVIDYGTSQGLPESGSTVSADPSDNPAQNPDGAKTAVASRRRVTAGPLSISAISRMPVTLKKPRVLPARAVPRRNARAVVPYSPFGRPDAVNRIKSLMVS